MVSRKAALSAVALLSLASLAACGRRALKKADAGSDGPTPPADAACGEAGSPDAGAAPAIPLGVYTACTSRVVVAGSTAEGAGGTIALTATGAVLTVEVQKGVLAFKPGTIAFTPITAGAAVVGPAQTYAVSNVPCATSTAAFGALALEGDKLVISLVGQGCGRAISGTLRCNVPATVTETLAPPPNPCSPAEPPGCGCAAPSFAAGAYGPCTASTAAFGGGTATVTQSEDVVMAALTGLTTIAPTNATLRFTPTTKTTATIEPGQTWEVLVSGTVAPTVPITMTIASGTIVVDRSMLFAFASGTGLTPTVLHESFHCGAED